MNLFASQLEAAKDMLRTAFAAMDARERICALNEVRELLHELSPFSEPVDLVLWVPADKVIGNDYNPNKVAPPEMRLLYHSIKEDGYTQPIVAYPDGDRQIVVDGFHRTRVGKEHKDIQERTHGYLPIVQIRKPLCQRMASTIRHNRARGKHAVGPMSEIVATLAKQGWSDDRIAKELGPDLDETLRLKQVTGLPELFANRDYSRSWE